MVKIISGCLLFSILSGSFGDSQSFVTITAPTKILYKQDDLSLSCLPTDEATSIYVSAISLSKNTSSGWTELVKIFADTSLGNVKQNIVWHWAEYENRVHNMYAKIFPANESGLQLDINNTSVICADQGSYRCSVYGNTDMGNTINSFSTPVYVKIKATLSDKPVIVVDGNATVGFTINLKCTYAEEVNCTYIVKWYVNETALLPGSSRYTIQSRLLMFKVEKSDKYHRYACEVECGNQSLKSDELSLQPKYPASAKMWETYTCNKSGIITIICEADGNPPNYRFKDWVHVVDGTEIRKLRGSNSGGKSSLRITRCNYQDAGLYYCTVRNDVVFPDLTYLSRVQTNFVVNDIPVISGQSVVNFTNGFDIMVSYYSQPESTDQRLYRNNIELVADKPPFNDVSMPLLYHRIIARVSGHVMIISVQNTGIYRYTIQNSYGTTEGTVDVGNSKSVSTTQAPVGSESADCSFASLGFGVQVVIIVFAGIAVCILVLAVAMVVIYRCGKTGDKENKVKERNKLGKRRLTRVKSIEEDGTVIYDEIEEPTTSKGKKTQDKNRCKYEDVSPKNNSGGYDTLEANKTRKSKSVFRKKSCKKSKRMENLVSTISTTNNVYTTDTPSTKKEIEEENKSRKNVAAIRQSNISDGYADAASFRTDYITMEPKETGTTVKQPAKNTDEYMNLKI